MDYESKDVQRLVGIIKRGLDDSKRGAILWVGAGMSIPCGYPSWGQLADQLREKSLEPLVAELGALQTIDAFVEENGRGLLAESLSDIFEAKPHKPYHEQLMRLPWGAAVTTNYDELLEDALKATGRKCTKVTFEDNLDLTATSQRLPLYKIHGDIANFRKVVLDGKSCQTYHEDYPSLYKDFESGLRKHCIVFFGCGMTDERLIRWLHDMGPGRRAGLLPSCAVITENDWNVIPSETRDLLLESNIKPLHPGSHEEIPGLIDYIAKKTTPTPSGPHLTVTISVASKEDLQWRVAIDGRERVVDMPWKEDRDFVFVLRDYWKLTRERIVEDKDRSLLHTCAVKIGETLGGTLLDDPARKTIAESVGADGQPPLLTLESDDDLILSLPWELIRSGREFLLREARIDLARTVSVSENNKRHTLRRPDRPMKLVVCVSAPRGKEAGSLNHEAESYRLAKAIQDKLDVHFTELGEAGELMQAIVEHQPTGIHFSGHGMPNALLFEDDEGGEDVVETGELLRKIRNNPPDHFPRFIYLASCHGNTPAIVEENKPGSSITAAHLHREGITQVVGYYGPVVDELSTEAEEAFYGALAGGALTRHCVRQARIRLAKPKGELVKGIHREASPGTLEGGQFPFAWAQLVFYHHGPDHPLSTEPSIARIDAGHAPLRREYIGTEDRQVLMAGFIGRRRELHEFRKKFREGKKIFVYQGLGGLGKTTLAFKAVSTIAKGECAEFTVWCREIETVEHQAEELVNQLSNFGQQLFGSRWGGVVQNVGRVIEPSERFGHFLEAILQKVPQLVIHLDNLESLLNRPPDEDTTETFADWRDPQLGEIWKALTAQSRERLSVVASCRYPNADFADARIPVEEMGSDAIFRMMSWYDALRRLSVTSRAILTDRLHGHPRAVEFLDDLIAKELRDWDDKRGEWVTPTDEAGIEREWNDLIESALGEVMEKIHEDLLLDRIWSHVLTEPCRLMLLRMTVLVRPWDWDLMMELGEPGEEPAATERTIEQIRTTSLLGEIQGRDVEGKPVKLFQVHPMTSEFITIQFTEEERKWLCLDIFRRIGAYLEERVKTSRNINNGLDAGHYLFECGEFDRAFIQLGKASISLQQHGMVRRGLMILAQFGEPEVKKELAPDNKAKMLRTIGTAYSRLAQFDKAIEYYKRSLKTSLEIGDQRGEGSALGNLGICYRCLGQIEKAIECFEQTLAISQEIGDREGEGSCHANLGICYVNLGQIEEAIEYHEQALAISQETGDRMLEGASLGNLGAAYLRLGQIEKAIEYLERALAIMRETGNRGGEGSALGNLGKCHTDLGQVAMAVEYLERALAISREIGDRIQKEISLGIWVWLIKVWARSKRLSSTANRHWQSEEKSRLPI